MHDQKSWVANLFDHPFPRHLIYHGSKAKMVAMLLGKWYWSFGVQITFMIPWPTQLTQKVCQLLDSILVQSQMLPQLRCNWQLVSSLHNGVRYGGSGEETKLIFSPLDSCMHMQLHDSLCPLFTHCYLKLPPSLRPLYLPPSIVRRGEWSEPTSTSSLLC